MNGDVTILTEEQEREMLAMAIRSKIVRDELLRSGLKPRTFRVTTHQWVWRAVASLVGLGKPVDLVEVSEELRRLGLTVGGPELVKIYHAADSQLILDESDKQFLRALRIEAE
jgi:replicative DNA helicase